MKTRRFLIATVLSYALAFPVPAQVQPPSQPAPAAAPSAGAKTFSQQELDQLLAPIALYPDALLAQVLMASTYPLEIVAAERWVKANPGLKDKALEDALQKQTWDPSVKSLAVFPQVLTMMSEKIDWTQKLGDAFLAQQKDVMATAQALRAKAVAEGVAQGLQGAEGRHGDREATRRSSRSSRRIRRSSTCRRTTRRSSTARGRTRRIRRTTTTRRATSPAARCSASPPASSSAARCGATATGAAATSTSTSTGTTTSTGRNISNGNWNHNAQHRGAVPYRDKGVAQQYGRGQAADAASRDAFRGRADAGRESIQRGDVSARDIPAARCERCACARRPRVTWRDRATWPARATLRRSTRAAARRRAITAAAAIRA